MPSIVEQARTDAKGVAEQDDADVDADADADDDNDDDDDDDNGAAADNDSMKRKRRSAASKRTQHSNAQFATLDARTLPFYFKVVVQELAAQLKLVDTRRNVARFFALRTIFN